MVEIKFTSQEGVCLTTEQCLQTLSHSYQTMGRSKKVMKAMQMAWIDAHDVFISGNRLYSFVKIRGRERVVDAITGTIYRTDGKPIGIHDLRVDMSNIKRCKKAARDFVRRVHQ